MSQSAGYADCTERNDEDPKRRHRKQAGHNRKYTRQKHKAPEEKHSLQHKVQKGTTKYKHRNTDQETTQDMKTDTEKD